MPLLVGKRKIDTIEIDGIFSEEHIYKNEITTYPVENGNVITDNVTTTPMFLSMQCSFNLYPLYNNGVLGGNVSSEVENKLTKLFDISGYTYSNGNVSKTKKPKVINVVTGLKSYENMIISEIIFNDNKDTQGSVSFSIRFMQIKIVNEKFETVNTATTELDTDKKVQKKINKGTVPATNVAEQKSSALKVTLKKIIDWGK